MIIRRKLPPSRSGVDNSYRKVAMGKAITEAIGIPSLRGKCAHFDEWLVRLEELVVRNSAE